MRLRAPALGLLLVVGGCDGPPLEQSCGGGRVNLCEPYEWADVKTASLEPAELPIADFSVNARVRVELDRCDEAPARHAVELSALVPGDERLPDGGTSRRLMHLETFVDGEGTDAVASDGVIDVEVPNPLIATVPAQEDIVLRFTARSTTPGGCTSGTLEVPYRTGPRRD